MKPANTSLLKAFETSSSNKYIGIKWRFLADFFLRIESHANHTSYLCLQTIKKQAFESLSRDFSLFKNVVVSLTNLCQGQLKISRENAKLPRKPHNQKRKYPQMIPPDVTLLAPIVRDYILSFVRWMAVGDIMLASFTTGLRKIAK